MKEGLSHLVEESIQIELNVAELYMIFKTAFSEDADFWWRLALEEKNHAALIRSIKESFMPVGLLPDKLLSSSLQELKQVNTTILTLIQKFKTSPPSRNESFSIACKLEESAAEIHFQEFMENAPVSKIEEMFQKLNKDDKDHAARIRSYMEKHGIVLQRNHKGDTS
jgi:hypothetical protein